jgi:hypothetical protein
MIYRIKNGKNEKALKIILDFVPKVRVQSISSSNPNIGRVSAKR